LFGPNYLINGSVGYFFWPTGAVKKLLKHKGRHEPRKFGNRWFNTLTTSKSCSGPVGSKQLALDEENLSEQQGHLTLG